MYKTKKIKLTSYQKNALLEYVINRYNSILKNPYSSKGVESNVFFEELIKELKKDKKYYIFKIRDLHWLVEKIYNISIEERFKYLINKKIEHLGRFYSMKQTVEKVKSKLT